MKKYYTAKEYKELLQSLVILHDTREQENAHIIDYFDKKGIKHKAKSLPFGDYCFELEGYYYIDELFIERKSSLDELAASILSERFSREIRNAARVDRKYFLIEEEVWRGILEHRYRSSYSEKAFWNTLHTYMAKYGIIILPCADKREAGRHILSICKAVLDKHILHG